MTATKPRPWAAPNEPYFFDEEWQEKRGVSSGFEFRSHRSLSRDKCQRLYSLLRLYRSASVHSHAPELIDVLDERRNKPTYETYGFGHGQVTRKVTAFGKSFRSETVEDYRRIYYSWLSPIANEVDWLEEAVQLPSRNPGATCQHRLTGPVQFLQKLLRTWRLRPADAVPLLGLEVSDLSVAVRLLSGREPLRGRDVKDRIAYLFRIRKILSALFRNEDVENDWLRERHDLLGGQMPMTLLLEGSMGNLLLVKEYVEAAAGR